MDPQQRHNLYIDESSFGNMQWIIEPESDPQLLGLAVGNIHAARDHAVLTAKGIGAILSVMGQSQPEIPSHFSQFRVIIADLPSQNISCFFGATHRFIHEERKKTSVLVHCQAGVSRSVSVVCAYLMRQKKQTFKQALHSVRQKRPIAYPNKGFAKQLQAFEKQLALQTDIVCGCTIY